MSELSNVVQIVYEFAGPHVLHRLLLAGANGRLRRAWNLVNTFGQVEIEGAGQPFVMEPDLVAGIAYGQLGYGLPTDGGPLDPQVAFAGAAEHNPHYAGEPFDLAAALTRATWPVVVVSEEQDLRTPRPIAERIVDLAPRGLLVALGRTGHSALDTHQSAWTFLMVAWRRWVWSTATVSRSPASVFDNVSLVDGAGCRNIELVKGFRLQAAAPRPTTSWCASERSPGRLSGVARRSPCGDGRGPRRSETSGHAPGWAHRRPRSRYGSIAVPRRRRISLRWPSSLGKRRDALYCGLIVGGSMHPCQAHLRIN